MPLGRLLTTCTVALLLLALPAQAHTRAQLDDYRTAWVLQADTSLSMALVDEWQDMAARHPWYFNPQPAPPQLAPATHTGMGSNVEQWRPLVATYFASHLVDQALCIMAAESGGNTHAKNPRSSAAGLYQFLQGTWDSVPVSVTGGSYASGQVYAAASNVAAAAWLQARLGWSPWTVRGLCR